MSVSASKVQQLLYGKNSHPATPATFLSLCELHKREVRPDQFNPLIPLFGGMSMVGGDAFEVLLFSGNWIYLCQDAGSDPKNAVICLASNYDDHQGMVALALETGMMANKRNPGEGPLLSDEDFVAVVMEVFGKNYADIHAMAEKWGVALSPEVSELPAPEGRTFWRGRLGHDVLIHPVTLEPCRDSDGSFLKYEGLDIGGEGEKMRDVFVFVRQNGEKLVTSEFPKQP